MLRYDIQLDACLWNKHEELERLSRACSTKEPGPEDQVLGLSRRRGLDKEPKQKKTITKKKKTVEVGRDLQTG